MAKVLVIGNGFDLYHKLPTRYTDFLLFVNHWEDFKKKYADAFIEVDDAEMIVAKTKVSSKAAYVPPVISKPEPKPPVVIPADIVGKQVKHKAFGVEETSIVVEFDKVGLKKMGYEFCMEKKMLEFI